MSGRKNLDLAKMMLTNLVDVYDALDIDFDRLDMLIAAFRSLLASLTDSNRIDEVQEMSSWARLKFAEAKVQARAAARQTLRLPPKLNEV